MKVTRTIGVILITDANFPHGDDLRDTIGERLGPILDEMIQEYATENPCEITYEVRAL